MGREKLIKLIVVPVDFVQNLDYKISNCKFNFYKFKPAE